MNPQPAAPNLEHFLAELLAEQQQLQTPVIRAATAHALQPSAWRAERFREIIPLSSPAPGQQYAFEVDLDSCSGCKACVSGCHSLNGLDDEETWRDVGLVYGLSALAAPLTVEIVNQKSPILNQTVTTACHHCADPACLNGCPVLAYEKDPVTGIVRHLDDQCIGCSYCVLKCPYDVPKYNERLGIVRKCDLCQGRLAAGEAPACAQACPTQAIKIVLVTPAAPSPYDSILSSASDPTYTQPTTRYVSKNPLPKILRAADANTLRPQHAHYALVILLSGTQLSLGLLFASVFSTARAPLLAPVAAALFFTALAASVAHLGQPLRAWRIFLGLRRSWLSREAVIFGAAAPLVALITALPHVSSLPLPAFLFDLLSHWSLVISHSALVLTTLGVVSSGMIYIDTRRHFWRPSNTFTRMGGTVIVAALACLAPFAAALALGFKLTAEHFYLRASPLSARLHAGPLKNLAHGRITLGAIAILLLAVGQMLPGFLVFSLGELIERTLYFRAVDAPKMPGQAS